MAFDLEEVDIKVACVVDFDAVARTEDTNFCSYPLALDKALRIADFLILFAVGRAVVLYHIGACVAVLAVLGHFGFEPRPLSVSRRLDIVATSAEEDKACVLVACDLVQGCKADFGSNGKVAARRNLLQQEAW